MRLGHQSNPHTFTPHRSHPEWQQEESTRNRAKATCNHIRLASMAQECLHFVPAMGGAEATLGPEAGPS